MVAPGLDNYWWFDNLQFLNPVGGTRFVSMVYKLRRTGNDV